MQKKKKKTVLKPLGLSVSMVWLCGAFTHAYADDGFFGRLESSLTEAQQAVTDFLPDAKPVPHQDTAPWHMRMEKPPRAMTHKTHAQLSQTLPQSGPAGTASKNTASQSFLTSAGLVDYLEKRKDVPYAVQLSEYSQYSMATEPHSLAGAAHHASRLPVTEKAMGYLDDDTPPAKPASHQTAHPVKVALLEKAPVLIPPKNARTPKNIQINVSHTHKTAQPVQPVEVAVLPAPLVPVAPAPKPRPADVTPEVALRGPEPVDRKKLEHNSVQTDARTTDTIKTDPSPIIVASEKDPRECIILPWLLPAAPAKMALARAEPYEVAEKLITLEHHDTEIMVAAGGGQEAPELPPPAAPVVPVQETPAAPLTPPHAVSSESPLAVLPFTTPAPAPSAITAEGNSHTDHGAHEASPTEAPVLIPPQNPADIKLQNGLSSESRKIAESLPPEKPKAKALPPGPVKMSHERKNALEDEGEIKKHAGVGIQISVKQPKINITKLLNSAYEALMSGHQEEAIADYQQILAADSSNKLALFGLATTYHRAGQLGLARPLYGKLLQIDPYNFEGLNNFLVLLADEDPNEAITELNKLEKTHPEFSPIPAQLAIIYEKVGDYGAAAEKMNAALNLAPENLKYRYNMAVILDKKGDWAGAAVLYRQILQASERGEKISASPEEIQQRLTFILSNRPQG